ncbi:MAG: hypothetical protein KEFWMYNX_002012, partial [Candidatus Fervidibacter sp.]
MLKFAVRLAAVVVMLVLIGCGGGGNGGRPPFQQPPGDGSENPTVSINASPTEVRNEETVQLTLLVSGGIPTDIRWRQSPSTPLGQFQQVSSNMWEWKAPRVSERTLFTLTVTVTFPTTSRETSTRVTVIPQQPPQPNPDPPVIQITYPWEDGKVNVVGDNIILTVKGYVYSRSNGYVNKV